MTIAILKTDPAKTVDQAEREAEGLDFEAFSPIEDEKEPVTAPLDASEATDDPSPNGQSETIPLMPGSPS